ncbi:hypothetical protein H2198_003803 [Neophaeococcomyces mojaviensis]|uniref:Uncharacterized protein n=1 Tax=Neophaeococcomyces mojaviensis TaxID=3383035 RepID=A0ACC3AAE5_9EURO|nr:hypothetical protein H2198_003803 [Knufia sp. JES_112]
MVPSKKDRKAFMDMMDSVIQNHMPPLMPCDCPQCKKRTKKTREYISTVYGKDNNKENPAPSKSVSTSESNEHHLCPDHKRYASPKRQASTQKDKDRDSSLASNNANQPNRNDKVNSLMKAESVQAVLDVFKSTPTTTDERDLSQGIQNAVADCKLFTESKAKIIEFCRTEKVKPDAVYGLLAKFRQERSILTTAIIKSNADREKCLQAIHRVDDLMCMLKDVAKEGKGPSGDDLRHSLSNMIAEVHELSKNPSMLYDELLDLREEHLDLLSDHEEQHQKFLDIESCHEKLHEKNKKLMDDFAALKQDYHEARRKIGALGGVKNEVSQTEKALEIARRECADLKEEIERLNADTNKINALKHENAQLKKKLAAAEVTAVENKVENKTPESIQTNKKKGKKGRVAPVIASDESQPSSHIDQGDAKSDPAVQKEIKLLQQSNADVQGQLDTAQTILRQLEVLLKKSELAKTKAIEHLQLEQATAQSWKELSEGHAEESNRLKQQLDQSMSHATTLQDTVHRLEQSLAETKDQLKAQLQKRPVSPSMTSQTSSTSKFDNESLKILRRLRSETAQLVQDLDSSDGYPGDPWNLVKCTRNIVAAIDRDLESVILPSGRGTDTPITASDIYLSFQRSDVGIESPASIPRIREATPPLFKTRPPILPPYRPLLPPGLAEPVIGRVSPKPQHLPPPIGTGRPSRAANGTTPSPIPASASTATIPAQSTNATGNGATRIDWDMWAR